MAEYIEREAAIDAIMKVYVRTAGYKARERVFEAEEAVHRLPAADVVSRAVYDQVRWERDVAAVPVVRCRDCEYSWEDIGGLTCSYGRCVDCIVREDFFCAAGVKREAADD